MADTCASEVRVKHQRSYETPLFFSATIVQRTHEILLFTLASRKCMVYIAHYIAILEVYIHVHVHVYALSAHVQNCKNRVGIGCTMRKIVETRKSP